MRKSSISLSEQERTAKNNRILLVLAIMIAGFNLRPAITSVGPLLGTIRDQIGLENWSAGIITSLPLIAFAAVSPLAPKIANRLGNIRGILLGLITLVTGIGLRSIPFTPALFTGTAIIGVGIALMNVLLPAIIKEKFPNKVGRMTSLYSTSMAVFAATASGVTVPLATSAGLGWELALLSWGLLVIVGVIFWFVISSKEKYVIDNNTTLEDNNSVEKGLWKSPIAWHVTLFMGLQSFVFYVMVSWLPEIMQDFGFSVTTAGWLVSYAQFAGLPSTFLAPMLAEKYNHQQGIVLGIGGVLTIGFSGLIFGGPLPLIILWITLIGFASGGSISLSLAFLGMRARNAREAGKLSGMAQSIGYLFAAIGPILIGLLFDITHTWTIPLIALVIVSILLTIAGLGAGRNKYVLGDSN